MEKGSWHVHLVFDLGKCCTDRGQVFDYQGIHPNIKSYGGKVQWKNTLRYLEKDNWFKTNIDDEMDEDIEKGKGGQHFQHSSVKGCRGRFPFHLIIQTYISIKACAKDRYATKKKKWTACHTLADFDNVPHILSDYAEYILSDEDIERPKSLIIVFLTRYGKTQWARSILEQHGYMATEWNVNKIDDSCRVMIFDDVPMLELLP
jgi:hypothetical protein